MKPMFAYRRTLAAAVAFVVLRAVPVFAQEPSRIRTLAVDPQTPTTIYAATYDGRLFKSTDAGASWSGFGPPSTVNVLSLAIDPQAPTTVYVGDDLGAVHKSADGGATWSRAVMDLRSLGICSPCGGVLALALDSRAPATVFSATDVISTQTEDGLPYTVSGNVYRSTDGGASFGAIGYGGPIVSFSSLAIAAGNPGEAPTLYAGLNSWGTTTSGGLLKSVDGGANWTSTNLTALGSVRAVAVDPLTPTTVYATDSAWTVFKSTDGGESWHASLTGGVAEVLAVDPVNPSVVYAGGAGIYKTTDAGATWNGLFAGIGDVSAIAIDPLDPSVVYAGTSTGVYKSTDGGTSWRATSWAYYFNVEVPASIPGGTYAWGDIFVPLVPDDGAAVISLWSSNSTVASVDDMVIIWGGFYNTGFLIHTSSVTTNTPVEIFAALDGRIKSAVTVVTPPAISNVRADPTSVSGGMQSTGTVTLRTVAPATGAVIGLASSVPTVAAVPASVTVAAGATNATFAISTSAVATQMPVTIFATYGGVTINTILTVNPPMLSSVTLVPPTIAGGAATSGTVTLSSPAPPGGAVVALSSDNAAALVPPSVTVAAGTTSATFAITTNAVATATAVTISGSYGGGIRTALLTVDPPALSSVSLDLTSITGGASTFGTVTLSTPAPVGGTAVALLSSSVAVATVSPSVTIAAGATSATFTISTNAVATTTAVSISATYSGVNKTAALTVNPPMLSSVSVVPSTIAGGASSIGTVALSGPAPAGGAAIALSSSDAAIAVVPLGVSVASFATRATFTVSTPACASGTVTITAAYGGASRSAALTVTTTPDTVAIQTADYFRKRQLLRVEAATTASAAALSVYETPSGAFIGMLTRYDGTYRGEFTRPVNPQNITVRSDRCGLATSNVTVK